MTKVSQLERIERSGCCSGCGLCASIAPESLEMRYRAPGYLRPVAVAPLDSKKDEAIGALCPGVNITFEAGDVPVHTIWGPILASRTGHATDPAMRYHASSGGVISALVKHLLSTKQVDWVLQVRASEEEPLGNVTVRSRTDEDVFAAAGSRYAPSAPLEKLTQYLDEPGRFAVVAKPCDIAAIRSLGKRDARVEAKISLLISFFCAGIPSLTGAKQIVSKLGLEQGDVQSFRYRGDGWPGYATAMTKTGGKRSMDYASSWGSILSKHVQFRCKICPDGSGGLADVVCGDAWECDENGYPIFPERDGRSLVITRTAKGESLVREAEAAGVILTEALEIEKVENMQLLQVMRKNLILTRIWDMRFVGRRPPRYIGLRLREAAMRTSLAAKAESFLGTIRQLTKRLVQG